MARVVKAKLGEDLRRINVEFGGEKGINMAKLVTVLSSLYGVPANKALKVRYVDEDNDCITITSDIELKEAFEHSKGALRLELELIDDSTNSPSPSSSSSPIPKPNDEVITILPVTTPKVDAIQERAAEVNEETDSDSDSDSDSDIDSDTETETEQEEHQQQQQQQELQEDLPRYDQNQIPEVPVPKEKSAEADDTSADGIPVVSGVDYLANEFHYHRLIMSTAIQDSLDKLKDQYNRDYRPKVNVFLDDVQAQAEALLVAIERTLDNLKDDFQKSPSAQEASKKFSEGLRELGTVTEPVMEQIRKSFFSIVNRLFEKKQPICNVTAPEILREMETFSSPPTAPETSSNTAESSTSSTNSAEVSSTTTSTSTSTSPDMKVSSQLSSDFIYVPEEAFKFEEQLRHIQSMGFSNNDAVRNALLLHNGDINSALDSLMMAE